MKTPFSKPAGRDNKAGKTAGTSRRQWLALRPMRNPDLAWAEEDGQIVLTIHRVQSWKTRLLNLLFPLPAQHRVVLDRIGSDVWRLADGDHTVEHIARDLATRYQLEVREAEMSLQQFFKELGRRGYIGFRVEITN